MKIHSEKAFTHSLIFIGMPGAGKSYWAQHLAAAWGREAIDLDVEIEAATGKSVSEIFRTKGEAFFRKKESETLQKILRERKHFILATGGGTPCFHDNLERMLCAGTVVYLEASVPLLAERISAKPTVRPLLQNLAPQQLMEKLADMLHTREPFYRQAHYTLLAEALSETIFAAL